MCSCFPFFLGCEAYCSHAAFPRGQRQHGPADRCRGSSFTATCLFPRPRHLVFTIQRPRFFLLLFRIPKLRPAPLPHCGAALQHPFMVLGMFPCSPWLHTLASLAHASTSKHFQHTCAIQHSLPTFHVAALARTQAIFDSLAVPHAVSASPRRCCSRRARFHLKLSFHAPHVPQDAPLHPGARNFSAA